MVKRILAPLSILVLLSGCATGGPSPASCIRNAKAAYQKNEIKSALENFQKVVDFAPWALEKKRFADEVALYRDAQVKYGTEQSSQAEGAGNLLDAWIWNIQVANVDPGRAECQAANEATSRLKTAIAADYLAKAQASLQSNDRAAAMVGAVQAAWFGAGDEAVAAMEAAAGRPADGVRPWVFDKIRSDELADLVRTDTIERVKDYASFSPYGVPIYFGDVPRYYTSLGTVQVKGMPIPRKVPSEYAKLDSLQKLTKKATAKYTPDAIINVHYWTKSKKAYTVGEAIRWVDLGAAGTVQSETLPEGLDTPSTVPPPKAERKKSNTAGPRGRRFGS